MYVVRPIVVVIVYRPEGYGRGKNKHMFVAESSRVNTSRQVIMFTMWSCDYKYGILFMGSISMSTYILIRARFTSVTTLRVVCHVWDCVKKVIPKLLYYYG